MIHTVKSNVDFDKQLDNAGSKLVVVDFYATWCGPCKEIEPRVRALAKKYAEKVVILKCNVEKFEEISDFFSVSSMPTFVFIKNKKKVASYRGGDETKLENKILNLIK